MDFSQQNKSDRCRQQHQSDAEFGAVPQPDYQRNHQQWSDDRGESAENIVDTEKFRGSVRRNEFAEKRTAQSLDPPLAGTDQKCDDDKQDLPDFQRWYKRHDPGEYRDDHIDRDRAVDEFAFRNFFGETPVS